MQLNLTPKDARSRNSHQIALEVRERLKGLELPPRTALKVVELPPGPPVLSTLLAEIYGPTPEARRETAAKLRKIFESIPFIVDVDDSYGVPADRLRVAIDQDKLEFLKVEQRDVYDTIQAYLSGVPVGYSHRGEGRHPMEIAIALPKKELSVSQHTLSTPVPANAIPGDRSIVELGDVVSLSNGAGLLPDLPAQRPPRRNGDRGTGGQLRSADLRHAGRARRHRQGGLGRRARSPRSRCMASPSTSRKPTLLWDGEWEVTYVTFRDMGAAFAIAMLGIYFSWSRSSARSSCRW